MIRPTNEMIEDNETMLTVHYWRVEVQSANQDGLKASRTVGLFNSEQSMKQALPMLRQKYGDLYGGQGRIFLYRNDPEFESKLEDLKDRLH